MNIKSLKIIGMIHLPPLVGFEWYPWLEAIVEKAIFDLKILEEGWIHAVIIENNYDIPHTKYLDTEIIVQMTYLCNILRQKTSLPLGICCLWNDWKSALSIAKTVWMQFVRIPVFVDHIETHYGYEISENPETILAYRKKLWAEDIKILTDIQVKHSTILNSDTIESSSIKAIQQGSDGLIITGKWTGDMPNLEELERVRKKVGDFPIITGSGTTDKNITQILSIADGTIVGTFLKTNTKEGHTINLRSFEENIDIEKVRLLTSLFVSWNQE